MANAVDMVIVVNCDRAFQQRARKKKKTGLGMKRRSTIQEAASKRRCGGWNNEDDS